MSLEHDLAPYEGDRTTPLTAFGYDLTKQKLPVTVDLYSRVQISEGLASATRLAFRELENKYGRKPDNSMGTEAGSNGYRAYVQRPTTPSRVEVKGTLNTWGNLDGTTIERDPSAFRDMLQVVVFESPDISNLYMFQLTRQRNYTGDKPTSNTEVIDAGIIVPDKNAVLFKDQIAEHLESHGSS